MGLKKDGHYSVKNDYICLVKVAIWKIFITLRSNYGEWRLVPKSVIFFGNYALIHCLLAWFCSIVISLKVRITRGAAVSMKLPIMLYFFAQDSRIFGWKVAAQGCGIIVAVTPCATWLRNESNLIQR